MKSHSNRTDTVSHRLSTAELRALAKHTKTTGMSRSEVIRDALRHVPRLSKLINEEEQRYAKERHNIQEDVDNA